MFARGRGMGGLTPPKKVILRFSPPGDPLFTDPQPLKSSYVYAPRNFFELNLKIVNNPNYFTFLSKIEKKNHFFSKWHKNCPFVACFLPRFFSHLPPPPFTHPPGAKKTTPSRTLEGLGPLGGYLRHTWARVGGIGGRGSELQGGGRASLFRGGERVWRPQGGGGWKRAARGGAGGGEGKNFSKFWGKCWIFPFFANFSIFCPIFPSFEGANLKNFLQGGGGSSK